MKSLTSEHPLPLSRQDSQDKHTAVYEQSSDTPWWEANQAESQLVAQIYRYASDPTGWHVLVEGLCQCLAEAASTSRSGKTTSGETTEISPIPSELAKRLLPHFSEALGICVRFAQQDRGDQVLMDGIEKLHTALALMDDKDEVFFINAAGLAIMHGDPDLSLNNKQLWISDDEGDTRAITSMLEQSTTRLKTAATRIQCVRLGQSGNEDARDPSAGSKQANVCVLFQPVQSQDVPQAILSHYALTPAEIKVVETLLQHSAVADIATVLEISELTVRDHLSSIYEKLGVRRKPELLQRLLVDGLFRPDAHDGLTNSSPQEPRQTHLLPLPDGRIMSYLESGDKNGFPVIVCHNFMGSGYEMPPTAFERAKQLGLRILVPERPGYGQSSPQEKRSHQDWCLDLSHLLESLGINQFDMIGHSIGCIYTLACMDHFGSRIRRVALVSPMIRHKDIVAAGENLPLSYRTTQLCVRHTPFLIKPLLKLLIRDDVADFYHRREQLFSPRTVKRETLQSKLVTMLEKPYYVDNIQRSLNQGIDAWAQELAMQFSPWEIPIDGSHDCHIWHGDMDDQIPLNLVRAMNRDIKARRFTVIEGEGHGFLLRHIDAILADLAGDHPASPKAQDHGELL